MTRQTELRRQLYEAMIGAKMRKEAARARVRHSEARLCPGRPATLTQKLDALMMDGQERNVREVCAALDIHTRAKINSCRSALIRMVDKGKLNARSDGYRTIFARA